MPDRHRPLNIVGDAVRRLRYEREISQTALAEACQRAGWDIGRDTIANIEGARRWVGDYEMVILARILKVEVQALLPPAPQVSRALRRVLPP